MMTLGSDVDISIGHVTFPGELVVRGWVRSGLRIEAGKDIAIEGGVEAATVFGSPESESARWAPAPNRTCERPTATATRGMANGYGKSGLL